MHAPGLEVGFRLWTTMVRRETGCVKSNGSLRKAAVVAGVRCEVGRPGIQGLAVGFERVLIARLARSTATAES